MFKNFEIDNKLPKAVYLQIIDNIIAQIESGTLKENDPLPSMNELASRLGVSMETVKKSYKLLRDKGMLLSSQGLGFFAHRKDDNAPLKIFLLFDKLSTYKLVLFRSFITGIEKKADITIHLHNQDLALFENLVANALDKYDYYIITPHFQTKDPARLLKIVSKIPNRKLLVLDKDIDDLKGNYGLVDQHFMEDAFNAVSSESERLRKYDRIVVISASGSMYHEAILKGMEMAMSIANLNYTVCDGFNESMMKKGTLFIVVCGQLDSEHFAILRSVKDNGLKLGEDVGVISYNDSPENEFICNGLATMSTDFQEMGTIAARMINSGEMEKVHNRFRLIPRSSL